MNVTFATLRAVRAIAARARGRFTQSSKRDQTPHALNDLTRVYRGRGSARGLIARWHIDPISGRLECRWSLDDDQQSSWPALPLMERIGVILAILQQNRFAA